MACTGPVCNSLSITVAPPCWNKLRKHKSNKHPKCLALGSTRPGQEVVDRVVEHQPVLAKCNLWHKG
jgi:hypothetical protein